jgi:hypothetical protein
LQIFIVGGAIYLITGFTESYSRKICGLLIAKWVAYNVCYPGKKMFFGSIKGDLGTHGDGVCQESNLLELGLTDKYGNKSELVF